MIVIKKYQKKNSDIFFLKRFPKQFRVLFVTQTLYRRLNVEKENKEEGHSYAGYAVPIRILAIAYIPAHLKWRFYDVSKNHYETF